MLRSRRVITTPPWCRPGFPPTRSHLLTAAHKTRTSRFVQRQKDHILLRPYRSRFILLKLVRAKATATPPATGCESRRSGGMGQRGVRDTDTMTSTGTFQLVRSKQSPSACIPASQPPFDEHRRDPHPLLVPFDHPPRDFVRIIPVDRVSCILDHRLLDVRPRFCQRVRLRG